MSYRIRIVDKNGGVSTDICSTYEDAQEHIDRYESDPSIQSASIAERINDMPTSPWEHGNS